MYIYDICVCVTSVCDKPYLTHIMGNLLKKQTFFQWLKIVKKTKHEKAMKHEKNLKFFGYSNFRNCKLDWSFYIFLSTYFIRIYKRLKLTQRPRGNPDMTYIFIRKFSFRFLVPLQISWNCCNVRIWWNRLFQSTNLFGKPQNHTLYVECKIEENWCNISNAIFPHE